ncbi:hypothetical protein EBZ39_03590 [bacterium]|nr:hypothetical protein [bacterium]
MAKRVSKPVITGVSEEQFNTAFGNYAAASATTDKVVAKMDLAIQAIREKHADELARQKSIMDEELPIIQKYCEENKHLFADKKSQDFVHGTVGFRTSPPALKTLPKWTWDKVLMKVKEILPMYVRKKEEVNKEDLLADCHEEHVAPFLNEVGVYVNQEERFFVNVKTEGE